MLLDEFMAILNRILRRFPNLIFPEDLKRMIWRWYKQLLTLDFLQANDKLQRQNYRYRRFDEDDRVDRGRPRREGPGF
jgi:hypothetical protein